MTDYLYDGTFEGLLTCVYRHYYGEKAAGIFKKEMYQPTMLNGYMEVETDEEKASKVYDAIEEKISPFDLRRVYRAYLSNDPEKEMKILRYIVLGFREGSKVSMLHGNPIVFDIQKIEKKIYVEKERMLQFVRFSVTVKGILYGKIEPDNDVLELTAHHFCERYRNDPFIIHDVGRGKALIAYRGEWYISAFDESDVPRNAEEEERYRRLWRDYFENIAIKERTNPRCQRNFMPMRYRKHLTEVNGL